MWKQGWRAERGWAWGCGRGSERADRLYDTGPFGPDEAMGMAGRVWVSDGDENAQERLFNLPARGDSLRESKG